MANPHIHQPVTITESHAMGRCSQLRVEFCECGAFKLIGVADDRWVDATSAQPGRYHTKENAANLLGISTDVLLRLVSAGVIKGRKVSGKRGAPAWRFAANEISRVRRLRKKAVSWAMLMKEKA